MKRDERPEDRPPTLAAIVRDLEDIHARADVLQGGSDVSGKRLQSPFSCGLEEVRESFDELLLMPDHGAVHIALAGIVAHYASGDPVWPLLVGPSGSGKTEVVTSVTSAPGVWSLSSLTPQTLLSGFESKGERPPPCFSRSANSGSWPSRT
jgi:hypothetical protein